MIAVLVIALLSYGFAAANLTISIDDLEGDRYTGSGNQMLQAGRFGTVLSKLLRGGIWNTPFSVDVLAVILLILAAVNLCILFRRIAGDQIPMMSFIIFGCVLISYPLMNEIWEYSGANFNVCIGFFWDSAALLLVHGWLHSTGRRNHWALLLASGAMMWVGSSYESLIPVYIFLVFALLALQIVYGPAGEKKLTEVLRQGLVYAGVLAAGLLLRLLVHQVILSVLDLESQTNGSTVLYWSFWPVPVVIENLIQEITQLYLLNGLIYFPITEFVAAFALFVVISLAACRKHGAVLLLPGAGMLFSLFILSLIQGTASPYRTCQVFAVFVAFTAMVLITWIQNRQWKRAGWVPALLCAAACWLCVFQAVYLTNFLQANHMRSQEEAAVIRDIGTKLEAEYDPDKPVIFIGSYEISDYTLEQVSIPEDSTAWKVYKKGLRKHSEIFYVPYDEAALSRKLPVTNVNSVLDWAVEAFGSQEAMYHLFEYYGFDYTPADLDAYPEAAAYAQAQDMPVYPRNGCIAETDEYIIVRLGENLQLDS